MKLRVKYHKGGEFSNGFEVVSPDAREAGERSADLWSRTSLELQAVIEECAVHAGSLPPCPSRETCKQTGQEVEDVSGPGDTGHRKEDQ